MNIDGRYDNESEFYAKIREAGPLGHGELWWRMIASNLLWSNGGHPGIVKPEVLAAMHALEDPSRFEAYRYLEPDDLAEPWTPLLLIYLNRVGLLIRQAEHGHDAKPGELPEWFKHDDDTDLTLSTGERLFANIIRLFKEAGLDQHAVYKAGTWWEVRDGAAETDPFDWVAYIEGKRGAWRKVTQWITSDMRWVRFQVDSNSLGFYPDINGPQVWQRIVDLARKSEGPRWKEFLQNMKMADIGYVMKNLPGAHDDPLALTKDPQNPFGYGVSTKIPSFGYRREHHTEILLASWAASVGLDLFDEEVWCG